jgi:hypothetical protein
MQGYIMGSVGPFATIHNNGQLEFSMQGYSKSNAGPLNTVYYIS